MHERNSTAGRMAKVFNKVEILGRWKNVTSTTRHGSPSSLKAPPPSVRSPQKRASSRKLWTTSAAPTTKSDLVLPLINATPPKPVNRESVFHGAVQARLSNLESEHSLRVAPLLLPEESADNEATAVATSDDDETFPSPASWQPERSARARARKLKASKACKAPTKRGTAVSSYDARRSDFTSVVPGR